MKSVKTKCTAFLLVFVAAIFLTGCDIGLTVHFSDPLPCTVSMDSSVETVNIAATDRRSFSSISLGNSTGQATQHRVTLATNTSFMITQYYYDGAGVYRQKISYFNTGDDDGPATLLIQGASGISWID